jgi:hypothetical protein
MTQLRPRASETRAFDILVSPRSPNGSVVTLSSLLHNVLTASYAMGTGVWIPEDEVTGA